MTGEAFQSSGTYLVQLRDLVQVMLIYLVCYITMAVEFVRTD